MFEWGGVYIDFIGYLRGFMLLMGMNSWVEVLKLRWESFYVWKDDGILYYLYIIYLVGKIGFMMEMDDGLFY